MNNLEQLYNEQEHFCENCPDRWDCGGMDYAYGAPIHVEEMTCPAEGDPEDLGCTYHDDYLGLLAEIKEAKDAEDDE